MRKKIINKNFGEWMIAVFFAVSFAMLSFYYMVQYAKWHIIFTVLISFICTLFLLKKHGKDNCIYAKEHPVLLVIVIFISVNMIYMMYQLKGIPNINMHFSPLPFRFFRFRWCLLAVPALCYLFIWVWHKISDFVLGFWKEMDQIQKKTYILITMVFSIVIIGLYMVMPQWYLQYDRVYSIDSGWCYQSIFQDPFYYDIRHPILNVVVFPIWTVVHFILQIFVPTHLLETLCVSCVQIINVQFLIFIGFMIEKLSQNKMVFFLYLASSPVLIFSFFFEKYQMCTFLLVLYVHQRCMEEKNPEANIILATGAMSTSLFLASNELLCKEPWKDKIQRFCRILLQGIALLVCTGRIHLLNPWTLLSEAGSMAKGFGLKGLTIGECAVSFDKMVQGSFWALSSAVTADAKYYLWVDLLEKISVFSILLLFIIVLGMIVSKKDYFVKFCTIWIIFAVVLFFMFQWSVHESPLFSIYFSWALIPMFQRGLQFIVDKLEWNEKVVYGTILISMLVVNILNIVDIGIFLKSF